MQSQFANEEKWLRGGDRNTSSPRLIVFSLSLSFPSLPLPCTSWKLHHSETPTSWTIHGHFIPRLRALKGHKKVDREQGERENEKGVGRNRQRGREKQTEWKIVGLPNLLGNVPPRINELGRRGQEGCGTRERLKGEKGRECQRLAPALIMLAATGANNSIIRSRSNPDRLFRLRRLLQPLRGQ